MVPSRSVPAPTLQLLPADSSEDAAAAPTVEEEEDDDTDTLSIVALVIGALGLVAGVTALVLTRRQRNTPTV